MKVLNIFLLIDSVLNLCSNRNSPILLTSNNSCVLKYCDENDFKNEICIKDNDIIRDQWLNNIITFGVKNCTFSKIAKYSNGDILASTAINSERSYSPYFYGLKNNGRPLFTENDKEIAYYPLNDIIDKDNYFSFYFYDGDVLIVKNIDNKEEEYLLNVMFIYGEIFLYCFEGNNSILYSNFEDKDGEYIRAPFFNLKDDNIFWAGMTSITRNKRYIYLIKFSLSKRKNENGEDEFKISIIKDKTDNNEMYGNMISCFETDSKHIICFYMESLRNKKYTICLYDEDFNRKPGEVSISSEIIGENIFFSCAHYEEESGLFIYYDKIDNQGPFPIITFKEHNLEEIKNIENLNDIYIDSYSFNNILYLNDFIKISKDFFCFSSVSDEKDILYIVIINIFDRKSKVKIRYYVIRTFGLYKYKFFYDLKLNTFKESITLSSSYCNETECKDSSIHYNSLIIFSYPNSTDVNKNIIDEIIEKKKKIEDLIFNFNLSKYVIIENNIFGLVYSKIIIKNIYNPNNINIISSKTNERITSNYELLKEDDIKALFENYDLFNLTINYTFEATEPDYTTFENYPETINTTYGDDETFFEKKTYSGRLSYYSLFLKDKLTKDCSDNCELCYNDIYKNCIIFKDFTTNSNSEMETPKPTEKAKDTSKINDIMDCINDDKINSECGHTKVNENEYQEIYDQVKNKVLNSTTYNGEKKVYSMENLILQVSKIEDQDDKDKSVINLGKCEEILKRIYGIDKDESLIIYKSDLMKDNSISSYVQYEVYNPNNLEPLNLSLCSEEEISISVSINFKNNTKTLYDSLIKSGHNFLDLNDSFYNDICVTYTTENGTDMSMSERQKAIEDGGNLNFCQEGCSYLYFNSTNKKAKCSCKVKETKTVSNFEEIIFSNSIMNKIFGGFQYSNYLVLKCYKLLFDIALLKRNIGFIFMTFIFISLLILFFIFIFKGRKKLEYYIKAILKNKLLYINNRKNIKGKTKRSKQKNKDKSESDKNKNINEEKKERKNLYQKKQQEKQIMFHQ